MNNSYLEHIKSLIVKYPDISIDHLVAYITNGIEETITEKIFESIRLHEQQYHDDDD